MTDTAAPPPAIPRPLTDEEKARLAARVDARRERPVHRLLDPERAVRMVPDRFRRVAAESVARVAAGHREPAPAETPQEREERLARQRAPVDTLRARRVAEFTAGTPRRFRAARLADLTRANRPAGLTVEQAAIVDEAEAIILAWPASGKPTLILKGPTGTGKSHAAYALGHDAAARGYWVLAWNVADLIDALRRNTLEGQVMADACACDLLILDELGAERVNEFAQEAVQRLVDARYRRQARLIVTTNLSAAEIEDPSRYGGRTGDRLQEDAAVAVYDGVPSRRHRAF